MTPRRNAAELRGEVRLIEKPIPLDLQHECDSLLRRNLSRIVSAAGLQRIVECPEAVRPLVGHELPSVNRGRQLQTVDTRTYIEVHRVNVEAIGRVCVVADRELKRAAFNDKIKGGAQELRRRLVTAKVAQRQHDSGVRRACNG